MLKHIHMQDQIDNRIEELMNEIPMHEHKDYDWEELFQNAATFALVTLFITLGVNW